MNSYLYAIETAIFIFPVIAFLVTIPYVLYNYHKYGSISLIRTLIVYSFILYMINAFFLVILPLPKISYVEALTTPRYQLIPFQFVRDINSVITIDSFSSLIEIFNKQVVLQVIYNVFMLIPFGIYMRYYFKIGFLKTIMITLILSLFFEITQLTGLYFIYPRGYRLFDVDDLILNTIGGVIGYLLTPLVAFLLPSRDRIDEVSYNKGERVGVFRRTMAFIIDNILIFSVTYFMRNIIAYLIVFFLYFVVGSFLMHGQTIGKKIVSIKVLSYNGEEAKWHQHLIRYVTLYIFFLPLPYYIQLLFSFFKNVGINESITIWIEIIFLLIGEFIFLYKGILSLFKKDALAVHEIFSKTKIVSSIHYEKSKIKKEIEEAMDESPFEIND